MGHVFAATAVDGVHSTATWTGVGPAEPGTEVAIKVVSRLLFDETLMARLRREAEAAARIRSDYVPRVLEVASTDDREVFLVMERLEGDSLSQRMKDKGPLPWGDVVQIGEDVLRGLIDAHTAGVVHRDIKPSNVFLANKGGRFRAMILDFGVCKTDGVDHERLTGTGESIGTVAYMAPEQIRGASSVDDRADLYAFGVLVFEMLAGRLPHDGPSQMAILASKLEKEPVALRDAARVAVPAGLDEVLSKALSRDPASRFVSAQELLRAWRKLRTGASVPPRDPAATSSRSPSVHDPHEAPTAVSTTPFHDPPTVADGGPLPLEAHPTQTALTAGISLRKGGQGRAAILMVGLALVAGLIGIVTFFARAPEHGAGSTSASRGGAPDRPAGSSSAALAESADSPGASASAAAPSAGDGAEPAPSEAPAASSASVPRRHPVFPSTTKAGHGAKVAPKGSAPVITSQPRY